jgi:hypothetical protein
MAKYSNCIIFDGMTDFSEEMTKKLKIYNVDKVSLTETDITIVGKGHPELWKMVELESGEALDDFEGIDDESKKIGHTLPITKINKVFETALGYSGRIEKLSEEEVLFIRSDSCSEEINESLAEQIEMYCELGEDVFALETMSSMASIIGNDNLRAELENRIIDLA